MHDWPTAAPLLAYADLDTALPWLARTFGFSEREEARFHNPDGTVGHAEMWAFGDVHFMLGSHGGHGLSSPRGTASGSQMLCIYVDDVEAHFRRAREEGATIRAEIADKPWGDRSYEADDLEGHRWAFCQKMRVVDPQDWHEEK